MRLWPLVITLCFSLAWAIRASAQWSLGLEDSFQTQISLMDVELLRKLMITEEEKGALDALYTHHLADTEVLAREGRDRQRALDEQCKDAVHGSPQAERALITLQKEMAEYADRQAGLDDAFLENVRLVLLPDSKEAEWNLYLRERRWRRVQDMPSSVPGAGVNLAKIVADMQLPQDVLDPLQETIDQYLGMMDGLLQSEIDAAIRFGRQAYRRTELVVEMNQKLRDAHSDQEFEAAATNSKMSRITMRGRHTLEVPQARVREANIMFADIMAAELPEDFVAQFHDAVEHAMHPNCYVSPNWAGRYASRVLSLGTLNTEQTNAVVSLMSECEQRFNKLNEQAAKIEEKCFIDRWKKPYDQQLVLAAQSERESCRHLREQTSIEFIDKIHSILTIEQQALAPKPAISVEGAQAERE